MSIVGRITRSAPATLAEPPGWLIEALGGSGGRSVSIKSALGHIPVLSAVTLISGTIATLPLMVYRQDQRAERSRAWKLLHDQPNRDMGPDELQEIIVSHLLLWGNCFLWKVKGPLGVEEVWPLDPAGVQVGRKDGQRFFMVGGRRFDQGDILQMRGLSATGLVGYSPIQLAKQEMANALAREKFIAEFLQNSGRPSIVLRHPNELSDDAAKRLGAQWDAIKRGGTGVLEDNISVETLTMPLDDAQYIEQAQLSDLRVAQMFTLPPPMIGAKSGDSLTYETVEGNGIDYHRRINRWLKRIEMSYRRDLDIGAGSLKIEFLVEGMLRADTKSRYDAYGVGLDKDFLTVNEVRARENLPPLKEKQNEDSE